VKKLTTLAILCLCSSLLANEGAVSIDLNSGKDIYSQCLDETIKELKKEDSEADINNAVVASCMEYTSYMYKQKINRLYKEINEQVKKAKNSRDASDELSQLETSQKTWIQYRNNKCALFNSGLQNLSCLMNENEQRIEKLKKIKVGDELFYPTEKNGNLSEDIYSQCLDEMIKKLKKEDPEAGINNAIVSYCIDSTSEQYKKQINQLYQEITRQIKQSSDLNEVNYDLKGLETFQKTWIRYRNSKCALVDPGLGEHYCLMSENRMRVEKLKKIKAGEEQFYFDEDFE
jgi:hypothetical protein